MILKVLTIEEIGEKLKNMTVGERKYLPMAFVFWQKILIMTQLIFHKK